MPHNNAKDFDLYVYNLSTSESNPILAFTQNWINSFAKQVNKVNVYSTHVGPHSTDANVSVHELGGGNNFARLIALIRLFKSAILVMKKRNHVIVFHHMSVNTAIFPGLLYRALRVPQVMWYSHSSTSLKLRLATSIVDKVVTSIENAFPISTPKIRYVGHGIDFGTVNLEDQNVQKNRSGLVYLGRIAKVKNLNNLLTELNRIDYRGQVDFIGPVTDQNHLSELKKISALGKYQIFFKEEIPHARVKEELSKYQFCFSGTPNSVDKATLEATAAGCILVTEMKPSIQLTGLGKAWEVMSIGSELKVGDQIQVINNLTQSKQNELRQIIMTQTLAGNELNGTTNRILQEALDI